MNIKHLVLSLIIVSSLTSCKNEDTAQLLTLTCDTLEVSWSKAILEGSITSESRTNIISYGFCWDTIHNPETATGSVIHAYKSDSCETGTYKCIISPLSPNTVYYVRPFIINEIGITYGSEVELKTRVTLIPEINTIPVASVSQATAFSGGKVISDNGAAITGQGICWSLEGTPTLLNNVIIAQSDSAEFTCIIRNLKPNTLYYVRSWATNPAGTSYGNLISFKTKDGVVDIDGNEYDIVKIGDQTWMAENLRVTHFRNGQSIYFADSDEKWFYNSIQPGQHLPKLIPGAYCYYRDNIENKVRFGALYNRFAFSNQQLAPEGWHVATLNDWSKLIKYAGGEINALSTILANVSDIRFSYLLGGTRIGFSWNTFNYNVFYDPQLHDYQFSAPGTICGWWCSDIIDGVESPCILITATSLRRTFFNKSGGLSIICVKD